MNRKDNHEMINAEDNKQTAADFFENPQTTSRLPFKPVCTAHNLDSIFKNEQPLSDSLSLSVLSVTGNNGLTKLLQPQKSLNHVNEQSHHEQHHASGLDVPLSSVQDVDKNDIEILLKENSSSGDCVSFNSTETEELGPYTEDKKQKCVYTEEEKQKLVLFGRDSSVSEKEYPATSDYRKWTKSQKDNYQNAVNNGMKDDIAEGLYEKLGRKGYVCVLKGTRDILPRKNAIKRIKQSLREKRNDANASQTRCKRVNPSQKVTYIGNKKGRREC
mmetsp:Transcript_12723/g.19270  ORF Transcript_12723/g.19270 Transcript_12723/m.19270 type:complete len:273 (+) Transcript_12723:142-960(+)